MTENIASRIDHTLLNPAATVAEIAPLCDEAKQHGFASVCVNPYWVPTVKQLLNGNGVKIVTVAGFPFGATLSKAKAQETVDAVEAGADEVAMVINSGAAREGHWDFIEHEIHDVVSAAKGRPVTVIVETGYLDEAGIVEACQRAVKARAHAVEASTGFGPGGATIDAVKLMRKTVGCTFSVKASGGIKDRAAAEALLEAGADRLGSNGVAIVK